MDIICPVQHICGGNAYDRIRSTDNVGNAEAIKTFNIVVDNTPPVTEITTGDTKFTSSDGKLYVTGSTAFTLSSNPTSAFRRCKDGV